jgi:hypothetical protein
MVSRKVHGDGRRPGVVFYSLKPADTDKFRKAVLWQSKDNERDAERVARYAMALVAQGTHGATIMDFRLPPTSRWSRGYGVRATRRRARGSR